ncbi:uncharacterized protein C7orf50 homolog [Nilaparvata lugens]|uniref:uncharacterized protein C7orf50 homolog n=1 Tax=Nilaparvata lugens TaxID=108931 RepID=UPI000B9904EB|nr:uncharacterized protein C7orf50 homolog [Nilaparvata lugens]
MKKSKGSKKKSKKNSTNSREDNDDHIKYLEAWKSDKINWKFEKVKQMRLLSGMFDAKKLPENVFPLFVEYMKNSTGNARKTAVDKATEIIDEMEKWTSLTEEDQEKATKPDIEKYERARTLIQTLE